jgi:hypothetical protein
VDPGFQGNLFIPLHNFTTSPVHLYIDGKHSSFVSIDFVRTTPFYQGIQIPSEILTVKALRAYFENSKKTQRILIEEEKVKRNELEHYLDGAKPRSQLAQFAFDNNKFEERVTGEMEKTKRYTTYERMAVIVAVGSLLIAVAGVLFATITYFRGFVTDVNAVTKDVKTLSSNASTDSDRLSLLESNSVKVLSRLQSLESQRAEKMEKSVAMTSTNPAPTETQK